MLSVRLRYPGRQFSQLVWPLSYMVARNVSIVKRGTLPGVRSRSFLAAQY